MTALTGGPPEMGAPAPAQEPAATTSHTHDQHTAVKAAVELLTGLGFGLSAPCACCGHPLTTARSLLAGVGPKCAAKAVVE